jgi:hypothetical protein
VEFETFGEFVRAVNGGRLERGDTVYVSSTLYGRLSEAERDWLWRHALDARLRLVTDVDVSAPIVVRRGAPDD